MKVSNSAGGDRHLNHIPLARQVVTPRQIGEYAANLVGIMFYYILRNANVPRYGAKLVNNSECLRWR
jgi:hypothetical protein